MMLARFRACIDFGVTQKGFVKSVITFPQTSWEPMSNLKTEKS